MSSLSNPDFCKMCNSKTNLYLSYSYSICYNCASIYVFNCNKCLIPMTTPCHTINNKMICIDCYKNSIKFEISKNKLKCFECLTNLMPPNLFKCTECDLHILCSDKCMKKHMKSKICNKTKNSKISCLTCNELCYISINKYCQLCYIKSNIKCVKCDVILPNDYDYVNLLACKPYIYFDCICNNCYKTKSKSIEVAKMKVCANCRKISRDFKSCMNCNKLTYYCSKNCQKENWKIHKKLCIKLSDQVNN